MGYQLKMDTTGKKTIVMAGLNKSGAVTIPAELRDRFGLRSGDKFELEADHSTGEITLRPITGRCIITGDTTNLILVNGKHIALRVLEHLSQDIKGESLLDFLVENSQLTESNLQELEEETLKRLEQLRQGVKREVDQDRETLKKSQEQIQKIEIAVKDIRAKKEELAEKRRMEEELLEERLRELGFIKEDDEREELDRVTESGGIRTTVRAITKTYKKTENLKEIKNKMEGKVNEDVKQEESKKEDEKGITETKQKEEPAKKEDEQKKEEKKEVKKEDKKEEVKKEDKKKEDKKKEVKEEDKKKEVKKEDKKKEAKKEDKKSIVDLKSKYFVKAYLKNKDNVVFRIESKDKTEGEQYLKINTKNVHIEGQELEIISDKVTVLGIEGTEKDEDSIELIKGLKMANKVIIKSEFDDMAFDSYPSRGYVIKKYQEK